uniref:Paired domain-containing protein n=1 Tax=Esox lucius TaxID=8010 RepID=A0AAY5K0X9_ESOLU
MARNKELSSETRQSILVLRNEGNSMREIAKKLKISFNAVCYSLHRTAQTGSNQNRMRSGRPRCTTEQEDKYIKVSSLRNRCLTGAQLAASLNSTRKTPVSMSTVKRRLQDAGLLGRVAKKKPYLRLANKKKRLRWAKEHRHWTEEDWKKVLWTDESKFEVFRSQRRTFVRLRPNEKMVEESLTPSVKNDEGNVMVWGCFGGGEVGDLYRVNGTLKKDGYQSILQHHAIPCGQRLIGDNFLLQQDNDPKHSSKLCKNYLGEKQSGGILSIMEWPAQSPDLNPIKLLWEELDRMVGKKCPSSQSNLWEVLQESWGEIPSDYLNKLTARMPTVCKAVIAANGGFFDESKV